MFQPKMNLNFMAFGLSWKNGMVPNPVYCSVGTPCVLSITNLYV